MPSLPTHDFQFLPIPNFPDDPPPLTLSNSSTWTYCGPLLTTALPSTFHTWSAQTLTGTDTLLPQLLPFLSAAHAFLREHGFQHYWLTVRASQARSSSSSSSTSGGIETQRWHTDGHFSDLPDLDLDRDRARAGRWKLRATLQGVSPLFAVDGARAREVLRREGAVLGCYGMEEYPRSWSFGVPGWLDGEGEGEGGSDEGEDGMGKF
ncbi:uncharacterized protein B0H64DRAFT_145039 [Chaetomium fimeti]|uniref:Uncharacterized protein n=1 Tax=Chaetomium fimeti TaxID=1854472 RepID=A0AAE0HF20_9PEZI|nr:hypothetical protein B0H64DRAFT_145039 [Chaetomium fimeti]